MSSRKDMMVQLMRGIPFDPGSRLFEVLTAWAHGIGNEPSLDSLVKRAVQLLREHFGFTSFLHLRLESDVGGVKRRDGIFDLPGIRPIDKEVLEDLAGQLKLLPFKGKDFHEGVNEVFCQRRHFMFFVLGEPADAVNLLLWENESREVLSDATRLQNQMLEFFVLQVQQATRWFHRFEKTESLLYRDDLTGLFNYRYLDVALESEVRRAARYNGKFSLLFIDLDNFKPINDQHGHLVGSEVLKQVAQAITLCLRDVDSVFRYGGDEYVVLLLEAGVSVAVMAAERIRRKIADTEFRIDHDIVARVTASIGVATFPDHGRDKTTLLKQADDGMYLSKKGGKNLVRVLGTSGDATLLSESVALDPINLGERETTL